MKDIIKVRSRFKDEAEFAKIPVARKETFDGAPSELSGRNYAVDSAAAFLHPSVQYLKVKEVVQLSRDTKSFILEPDFSHGTASLAYFRPGQYISITLQIGQSVVTRPYTLCSSPKQTKNEEYCITVKKNPRGFASAYIFDNWVKGTEVTASAPNGTFYYQPLRDARHNVGIADSDGIYPFVSMARAISEGTLNLDLTVLYGARKKAEAVYAQEIADIAAQTPRVKIALILSDERIPNCERGFITKGIIEKYAPRAKYSVFVCGSTPFYNLIAPQIAELNLERRFVRFGLTGQIKNPTAIVGFPPEAIGKTFLCKVIVSGEVVATIPCQAEETVLVALEREGIAANSSCRSGECGYCRAKLTKGNVFIPKGLDYRREADSAYGIIHPCCSYPMSDLTIVLN